MSITDTQLDDLHERINALSGRATDEYDRGANDAIRDALLIIESFGGMDPQDRAGDGLGAVVRELSDRNEILESQLRVMAHRAALEAEAERSDLQDEIDGLKAELSDRNEILDNKLRVQTIRRERAEREVAALRWLRDARHARLTRDGVPDSVTVTASDTEGPEIKRLECTHDIAIGGDGYFECGRCGVIWDSRRETADTVARRNAIARLREQQREVERLRAERFALREGVLSALGGTGCDTPGGLRSSHEM